MINLLLILLATPSLSHDHHDCIHDRIEKPHIHVKTTTQLSYRLNPIGETVATRSLETTTNVGGARQPLRIHTEYKFDAENDLTKKIKETFMPAAVCVWTNALRVNPVSTPLRFDRACGSSWQVDGKPCAAFAPGENKCGTDAILSENWMNELTACTTQPGEDCTTKKAGAGLPSTDFAIIVKATETTACQNSPDTLGYAYACRFDQYNRPILGFINFCPAALRASTDATATSTAAHEMAHALGFSSQLFPQMREDDGTTPRTPRGNDGQVVESSYTCADGAQHDERPAASTTLVRSTVRGNPNAFTMVTPRVKAEAIKHFGCSTAIGAELENQPTGEGCWGSHWEQRLFQDELMAPVGSGISTLSSFTLAAFADMGFYSVNASMADELLWGKGMGCEFINGKCIDPDTGVAQGSNQGYFCSSSSKSCSLDLTAKSTCDVATFTTDITPAYFQYFPDKKKQGGADITMDFCPYFKKYSNQDCTDASHVDTTQNARGEIYGDSSRCFDSTLIQEGYVFQDGVVQTCFRTQCLGDGTVQISATTEAKNIVSVVCASADKGTEKTMPNGFKGNIVCPDVDAVCRVAKPSVLMTCSGVVGSTGSSSGAGESTGTAPGTAPGSGTGTGTSKTPSGGNLSGKSASGRLGVGPGLMVAVAGGGAVMGACRFD